MAIIRLYWPLRKYWQSFIIGRFHAAVHSTRVDGRNKVWALIRMGLVCTVYCCQDNTQQTMLTTWLIELFLNELGNLTDNGEKHAHSKLQQEFHSFLSQESLRVWKPHPVCNN